MAKKKSAKKKTAPFKEVTTGQEQPKKKGLLEELEELRNNGETSTARYREVMREVEVLYGTGETNSFGTNDIGILKENLEKMSKADLQTFAKKVGINPFYEKHTVVENIIKEFRRQQSRTNVLTAPQPIPAMELDPENPQHKEILDWLKG
jgi:lysophospholipase L1-like esterase